MSAFLFFAANPAIGAEPDVEWAVKPDPLPWKIEPPTSSASVTLPTFTTVCFPSTQSPFFGLVLPGKAKAPSELKMYDLRTMAPVGATIKADSGDLRALCVSPWGDRFAAPSARGDKPAVQLWSGGSDRVVSSILVSEEKGKLEALDFVARDRVITLRDYHEGKRGDRLYQVWDTTTGKEVTRFQFNGEYSNKWTSFTPGRRYFIYQETHTTRRYHVLFFDLTTGKLVGRIEQQEGNAPWGQCGHISVSPDGKEAALVWRLKKDGVLAKIQRFDLVRGVKIGEHTIKDEMAASEHGLLTGGMRTFQFLPDGRGWLVSGQQIVGRENGKVVYNFPPPPKHSTETPDRRFVDAYHITEIAKDKKSIKVVALPKGELDAALDQTANASAGRK